MLTPDWGELEAAAGNNTLMGVGCVRPDLPWPRHLHFRLCHGRGDNRSLQGVKLKGRLDEAVAIYHRGTRRLSQHVKSPFGIVLLATSAPLQVPRAT